MKASSGAGDARQRRRQVRRAKGRPRPPSATELLGPRPIDPSDPRRAHLYPAGGGFRILRRSVLPERG